MTHIISLSLFFLLHSLAMASPRWRLVHRRSTSITCTHALNTRASARAHIHVLHPRALVHTCTHVYSDGAQAERPITVREYFLEGRRSRSKATGGRRGGRTVEVGESGRTEVVVVRKRRVEEEEGSEASVAASLTPRSLFLGRKSTWPDDCVCRLNGPVATAAAVCHYCSTAPHTAASWLVHSGTSVVRALQCQLTRWERNWPEDYRIVPEIILRID